jgi:ABC-type sugar transport system ATPase subunit
VALVPQDYTRWPLAARENITLGQPGVEGDSAVHAAAEAAGADTVIAALPHGLDTSLARSWWGGHDLSGGQWQRIAVARAFHRDAPVLVMDEPTAALDARAEHRIYMRLRALAEGRATVFVTHRLANTRLTDRIIVLDQGRISGMGTYEELIDQARGFFEMLKSYVLCDDLVALSQRLDREASVNRWVLLAGLVRSVAALVISRVRRGRVLPVLMLTSVLILVVLADDHAARADSIALRISVFQTCDEPTNIYNTSRGWFNWNPLGGKLLPYPT